MRMSGSLSLVPRLLGLFLSLLLLFSQSVATGTGFEEGSDQRRYPGTQGAAIWYPDKVEPVLEVLAQRQKNLEVLIFLSGVGGQGTQGADTNTGRGEVLLANRNERIRLAKKQYRSDIDRLSEQLVAMDRAQRPAHSLNPQDEQQFISPPVGVTERRERRALAGQLNAQLGAMRNEVNANVSQGGHALVGELTTFIEDNGGRDVSTIATLDALSAVIPGAFLFDLANHPGVVAVRRNRPKRYDLDGSVLSTGFGEWHRNGLTGSVWELGILEGVDGDHPASSDSGITVTSRPGTQPTEHGSHVAGIIAGNHPVYLGGAYGIASILAADTGANEGAAMADMEWMMSLGDQPEVIKLGLSWDADSVDYRVTDRFYDDFIDQYDVLIVNSVGNHGWSDSTATLADPANAYNVISVANMDDRGTSSRNDDVRYDNPNDSSDGSSVGPTIGGRKKPDISAPGTNIVSVNSHWLDPGQPPFKSMTGSSLAASHVSAAALLLMEGGNWSPMAQKAVLINTADPWDSNNTRTSDDDGEVIGSHWDKSYGWGYLDMASAYFHRNDFFLNSVVAGNEDAVPDDYQLYKGSMWSGERATLVWHKRSSGEGAAGTGYPLTMLKLDLYDEQDGALLATDPSHIDNVLQVTAPSTMEAVIKVSAVSETIAGADSEPYALAVQENFTPVAPPAFDIELELPPSTETGADFDFDVTVTNTGDVASFDNTISLTLPAGFTLSSSRATSDLGQLAVGEAKQTGWTVTAPWVPGTYNLSVTNSSDSYGKTLQASAGSAISVLNPPQQPALISSNPGIDDGNPSVSALSVPEQPSLVSPNGSIDNRNAPAIVTVAEGDLPQHRPTAELADVTVRQGNVIIVVPRISDADGDAITGFAWRVTDLDTGDLILATTGSILWTDAPTLTGDQIEYYQVQVIVTDERGAESLPATMIVTILGPDVVDLPPSYIASGVTPQHANLNDDYRFTVSWDDAMDYVVDVEGRYRLLESSQWTAFPEMLTAVPDTDPPQFTRTLTITSPGTYVYQFRAKDADSPDGRRKSTSAWKGGRRFIVGTSKSARYRISAGVDHSCALDDNGVICWGNNDLGQTDVPTSLNHVIDLSAKGLHSCALQADGQIICWGSNSDGQLDVPALDHPVQVSVGASHSCALDSTGVHCWGDNIYGQTDVPTDLVDPIQVSAGGFHTCALDGNGIACWGWNEYGQADVPETLEDPVWVSANGYQSCALDTNGITCWGRNDNGQLDVPVGLSHPHGVSVGLQHVCAMDINGVNCWGDNSDGQTDEPSLVYPFQIASGYHHSCAIDINGVSCWGKNDVGQASAPTTLEFPSNRAPIVELSDREADHNTPITIEPTISDPDGDPIDSYDWRVIDDANGNEVAAATTAVLSYTTPELEGNQSRRYRIELTVIDGFGHQSATAGMVLTIRGPVSQQPPVVVLSNQVVEHDSVATIIPKVFDPDGDAITSYAWSVIDQSNGDQIASADTQVLEFTTPVLTNNISKTYQVWLTVTDARGAQSQPSSMLLTVVGPGLQLFAPDLEAALLPGLPALISPVTRYTGNNILSYQLLQGPTGMSIDANSGLLRWTPPSSAEGTTPGVRVSVGDGQQSAEVDFTLAVAVPTPIATVVAGNTLTVTEGNSLQGLSLTFPSQTQAVAAGVQSVAAITDTEVAVVAAANAPPLPPEVTRLSEFFRITPQQVEQGDISIAFPDLAVPDGYIDTDLSLYVYTDQSTDSDGYIWLRTRRGISRDANGIVSIRLKAVGELSFIGVSARSTPDTATLTAAAGLAVSASLEGLGAPLSPLRGSTGTADGIESHCVDTEWFRDRKVCTVNGDFQVTIEDFNDNQWTCDPTIHDLVAWTYRATQKMDELHLSYNKAISVVVESLPGALVGLVRGSENDDTLHLERNPEKLNYRSDGCFYRNLMEQATYHEYFHNAQSRSDEPGRDNILTTRVAEEKIWLTEGSAVWFANSVFNRPGGEDSADTSSAKILLPGLNAASSYSDLSPKRSYARGYFWSMIEKRCGINLRWRELFNIDENKKSSDPTGVVNLKTKLALSDWQCDFSDGFGDSNESNLAAALLYYQDATTIVSDVFLLVKDPAGQSARTFDPADELPVGATLEFELPAVAAMTLRIPVGEVPAGRQLVIVVDGSDELYVDMRSKTPDAEVWEGWVNTTEQQGRYLVYFDNSNGGAPRTVPDAFVTLVNPSTDSAARQMSISSKLLAIDTPTNLQADIGSEQVTLNWDPVDGASAYRVYQRTGTGLLQAIGDSAGGPYLVEYLSNGQTYHFAVQAENNGALGPFSAEVQATPELPLGTPGNVQASPGSQQIALSWDPVAGADGYRILYATQTPVIPGATGVQRIDTTAHSQTLSGLTSGQRYYVTIQAHRNGLFGAPATIDAVVLGPPFAPTLKTPAGTTYDATPTYTWGAVSGATWYQLWVDDATGSKKVIQWYTAETVGCGDGVGDCSVTPTIAIEGSVNWYVQSYNAEGKAWSKAKTFHLIPPAATALIAPLGSIADATPAYSWNAVEASTWYRLWVGDAANKMVFDKWYTAADLGCGDGTGTCSVTPTTAVKGDNQWWVQTYADHNQGPWSTGLTFTAPDGRPAVATLISPVGAITDPTPTYTWNAADASTWYYLWVGDIAGKVEKFSKWYTDSDARCGNGEATCSVTPNAAIEGDAQWWLRTYNATAYGDWSDGKVFSAPTRPQQLIVPIAPSGNITDSSPSYRWNPVSAATEYHLWVDDETSKAKIEETYSAVAAGCDDGVSACSVTATTAVTGKGRWWVMPANAVGNGLWNTGMSFEVTVPLPGQVALISPIGAITDTTPTYTWNAVSGAVEYDLSISSNTGNGRGTGVFVTAVDAHCGDGTGVCSATPSYVVDKDNYWVAAGVNAAGHGPWSEHGEFFIAEAPEAPNPLSPAGYLGKPGSLRLTYEWDAVPGATEYRLTVNNSGGANIDETFSASEAGCSSGTGVCSFRPTTSVQYWCFWQVQAINEVGPGDWSPSSSFYAGRSSIFGGGGR